ncbi:MAG: gp7 family phage scaffolding protein [Bacilli bacterium]|nr:gp7 family phage scaffolding protein [Bacilli bacterium]
MLSSEEFISIIENIRNNLNETDRALISDSLGTLVANQQATENKINELNEQHNKDKALNDELLLTNGRLFQQIGVKPGEENKEDPETPKEEKKIDIKDIINEKGELM